MTVDHDTWFRAKGVLASASRLGVDEVEALDQSGLLLSVRKRNELHRQHIDRMLILLRNQITPYQLQELNRTERDISAAGTHAGFITWLEQMREEYE